MNIAGPHLDGTNLRIGVVQARLTSEIGSEMVKACYRALEELGVAEDNIALAAVPDALEVPIALMNLAPFEQFDTLIAIGVIIHGKIYHFESISDEPGTGVSRVALDYNIPIASAILTTENDEQAIARIEEKASDAAKVTVEYVNLVNHLLPGRYKDDEE